MNKWLLVKQIRDYNVYEILKETPETYRVNRYPGTKHSEGYFFKNNTNIIGVFSSKEYAEHAVELADDHYSASLTTAKAEFDKADRELMWTRERHRAFLKELADG